VLAWINYHSIGAGAPQESQPIHKKGTHPCYDLFLWEKWIDLHMAGWRKTCTPGESFLGEYKAIRRKYSSLIKIYVGDLHQLGWIGKPIEFLLVDAMKSQELAESSAFPVTQL
jgi:hypothetical protein